MNPLVERFRRGLQSRVEIEPGKFIVIRRPLPGEKEVSLIHESPVEFIAHFTDTWEGFTELDIFPGGDTAPFEFDKELFGWWIKDHPELWGKLADSITALIVEHNARLKDAKKK